MVFFENTWFGKQKTLTVIFILKIKKKIKIAVSSSVSCEQSGILWQTICKQTHIFSATSAQNYFAKQFLGGCSAAGCSSWEPCFDKGLSSPWFVSLCLHWLSLSEASLRGCESWASTALISRELWGRQRTASTSVAGAKGFSLRKSLWKYFWC